MLLSKWSKWKGIAREERLLLIEAGWALAVARAARGCLSFARIAVWFGSPGAESSVEVSPQLEALAGRVGKAVKTISSHLPWENRCLDQAIAAWLMLKIRGVTGTAYIGVAQDSGKNFQAHAWLRYGTLIVTGDQELENFQVLASFSKGEQ